MVSRGGWRPFAGQLLAQRGREFVFRNSRLLFGFFVLFALLVYVNFTFWPSENDFDDGPCFSVFDHQMSKHYAEVDQFDAAVSFFPYIGVSRHSVALPFVGNGYVGVSLGTVDRLLVKHPENALMIDTDLNPVYRFELSHPYTSSLGAVVTRYKDGVVEKHSCFESGQHCIRVHTVYYASRLLRNVFVQEVNFYNPTRESVMFSVHSQEPNVMTKGFVKATVAKSHCPTGLCYTYHGQLTSSSVALAISVNEPPQIITVPAHKTHRERLFTVVVIHNDTTKRSVEQWAQHSVSAKASTIMLNVTNMKYSTLYLEHVGAWHDLWTSGFSIAYSRASESLNGDSINATLYYMLSSFTYERNALKEPYRRTDSNQLQCYSSHSTLLNPSKLWVPVTSLQLLMDSMRHWHYTLVEHGCESLVASGARGVMQAMILSFGAFKHTLHHLQFEQQPNELHRDCQFRNIEFSHGLFVNIWVKVNAENKAVLYASMNRTNSAPGPLYACDAGCVDPPLQLSERASLIPLRQTSPPTAVLYITDDKLHFERLRMSIHVKRVVEAPAHENHVIAMHKHGHRLGGLPKAFWFTLGFLLIVFHLFLFKLIYNEHKGSQKALPSYRYSR